MKEVKDEEVEESEGGNRALSLTILNQEFIDQATYSGAGQ